MEIGVLTTQSIVDKVDPRQSSTRFVNQRAYLDHLLSNLKRISKDKYDSLNDVLCVHGS